MSKFQGVKISSFAGIESSRNLTFSVVDAMTSQGKSLCHLQGNLLTGLISQGHFHMWTCPKCDAHHDRDVNPAMHILKTGRKNGVSHEV